MESLYEVVLTINLISFAMLFVSQEVVYLSCMDLFHNLDSILSSDSSH